MYSFSSTVLTTSTPTAAPSGALSDSSGSSGTTSGISSQTKNIIIGVVVSIGGVALLGGLAFVAWRIWGKRRNVADEDDILMNGRDEKDSGPDSSPFKSTLDQYHNPAPGRVNASANF